MNYFPLLLAITLGINVSCTKDEEPETYPSKYENYQTQNNLELPFEGEWSIFWGGRSVKENYHTTLKEQRYALDIVQRVNGRTHENDGSANEDYFCFGKRLNAPADGIIIDVVNNITENRPTRFNYSNPTGNRVVIKHAYGEYSIMAHFKHESITVNVGDTVIAGQQLGLTGNTGASSEPHLHYHLQTTADPFNGEGLPAQFLDYYADNILVERGEPSKGQLVRKLD